MLIAKEIWGSLRLSLAEYNYVMCKALCPFNRSYRLSLGVVGLGRIIMRHHTQVIYRKLGHIDELLLLNTFGQCGWDWRESSSE